MYMGGALGEQAGIVSYPWADMSIYIDVVGLGKAGVEFARNFAAQNLTPELPVVRGYVNFQAPDLGNTTATLRAYYGDNLERLSAVKAAVDPTNLFTYPQAIPLPSQ